MKVSTNGGRGEVNILVCRGDLNAISMIQFKNRLSRLIHQKRKRLILDLAKARHADCSGLGILVERLQKVRAMNGDIRVINLQPAVSETFNRIGVDHFIESFGSKADAIRSYQVAT